MIEEQQTRVKTYSIAVPYIFAQSAAFQATRWCGSDTRRTEMLQIFGRKNIDWGLIPENNPSFKEMRARHNEDIR
jgi:hypothetical protein